MCCQAQQVVLTSTPDRPNCHSWQCLASWPDGTKRIADDALVAMTLLIAESRPADKSLLANVIVNLVNKRNP
jgi:hypothetical protein